MIVLWAARATADGVASGKQLVARSERSAASSGSPIGPIGEPKLAGFAGGPFRPLPI